MSNAPQNLVDALNASARRSEHRGCYVSEVLASTFEKKELDAIERHRTMGMSLAELLRVLKQFEFHVGRNGFYNHFNGECHCQRRTI